MKKTTFRFFKNTPLTDFQNTIHFQNNQERDAFFLEGSHYPEITLIPQMNFNFIRDRSTIVLDISYNEMKGVNYCTFLSDFEPGLRYYAYVMGYEYLNDNAVEVKLLIDGIMTHTQGTVLNNIATISNVEVLV